MGGFGGEREVSLRSGENVFRVMQEAGLRTEKIIVDKNLISELTNKRISFAVNVLHGTFGEDGQVQSILDFVGIPYTGEGSLASALAFHKVRTKEVLLSNYYKTSEYLYFSGSGLKTAKDILDILALKEFSPPLILKPVEGGSSVGVKLVKDAATLKTELETLEKNGLLSGYFAERFLSGREVTVGIYRERGELRILPILELKPKNEFYDYDAKYTAGKTEMILPAPLSKATQTSLEHLASKVFQTFGFRNCVRIDIIIQDDIPHILEINTQPGMTETSDIPAMLASAGIPVAAFLAANIENAKNKK